jgi:hypothetical protein
MQRFLAKQPESNLQMSWFFAFKYFNMKIHHNYNNIVMPKIL